MSGDPVAIVDVGSVAEAVERIKLAYFECFSHRHGTPHQIAERLFGELATAVRLGSEPPHHTRKELMDVTTNREGKVPSDYAIGTALRDIAARLRTLNTDDALPLFCVGGRITPIRVVGPRGDDRRDASGAIYLALDDTKEEDGELAVEHDGCRFAAPPAPARLAPPTESPILGDSIGSPLRTFVERWSHREAVHEHFNKRRSRYAVNLFGPTFSGRRELARKILALYRSSFPDFEAVFSFSSNETATGSPMERMRKFFVTIAARGPVGGTDFTSLSTVELSRIAQMVVDRHRGTLLVWAAPGYFFDCFDPGASLVVAISNERMSYPGVLSLACGEMTRMEARRVLHQNGESRDLAPTSSDWRFDQMIAREVRDLRRADVWDELALLCGNNPLVLERAGRALGKDSQESVASLVHRLGTSPLCVRGELLRAFSFAGAAIGGVQNSSLALEAPELELYLLLSVADDVVATEKLRTLIPNVGELLTKLDNRALVVSRLSGVRLTGLARVDAHERIETLWRDPKSTLREPLLRNCLALDVGRWWWSDARICSFLVELRTRIASRDAEFLRKWQF